MSPVLPFRYSRKLLAMLAATLVLTSGLTASSAAPKQDATPGQDASLTRSIDRAIAFSREQRGGLDRKANSQMSALLERQVLNLETSKKIVTMAGDTRLPGGTLAIAREAMVRQALSMDVQLSRSRPALLKTRSPGEAASEMLARAGVLPGEDGTAQIAMLDSLREPLRSALGDHMSAFLEFDEATRTAFGKRTVDAGHQNLAGLDIEDIAQILSARLILLGTAETLREGLENHPFKPEDLTGTEGAPEIGPELDPPMPHKPPVPSSGPSSPADADSPTSLKPSAPVPDSPRTPNPLPSGTEPPPRKAPLAPTPSGPIELKLSSLTTEPEASTAGAETPNPQRDECPSPFALSPVFCIDMTIADNTYRDNYAFQIDAGGHDTYLNNAGGNSTAADNPYCEQGDGGFPIPNTGTLPAAHLLDLSGNDQYATSHLCGGNGGAYLGTAVLVDYTGNDKYTAGVAGGVTNSVGLNGGGNLGLGFLLDDGGDDLYSVKGKRSIGSINGGATAGSGFLLDSSGNDLYVVGDAEPCIRGDYPASQYGPDCGTEGVNGGSFRDGHGFLLDLGGNDSYSARSAGVNGGGSEGGVGFLLDAAGNDSYRAGDYGANGGAYHRSSGFLLDASGYDSYEAGWRGTNGGGSSSYPTGAATPGLLLDAGGVDSYKDTSGPEYDLTRSGSGWDKTVIPKGMVAHLGAQIDENTPSADLGVGVKASPDPVSSGRNLTYSIKVENHGRSPESRVEPADPSSLCETDSPHACYPPGVDAGPDVAEEVTVTDELPAGVHFTSASASSGECTKSGNTVTCKLGSVAVGQDAQVDLVVTPYVPAGSRLTNQVSVASSPADSRYRTPDPNPNNNRAQVVTTVTEGDPVPSLSISDAPATTEGNLGSRTNAAFNVRLLGPPADGPVSVEYQTSDISATIAGQDYEQTSGSLLFQPGEPRQRTIEATVKGDVGRESDETFAVKLSNPSGAMIANGQGDAVIIDDDPLPAISVNDVDVQETDSGFTAADFSVSLTAPSGETVSVDYETADGTATVADNDYGHEKGTLTFGPGTTAETVRVLVSGDRFIDPEEHFFLNLSNARNAAMADGQGTGRILKDNDSQNRYAGEVINPRTYSYQDGKRPSGGVFVSGHDAPYHASQGSEGAKRIIQQAVSYVTGGKRSPRLLYVSSGAASAPPCNAQEIEAARLNGSQQTCYPVGGGPPGTGVEGVLGMRAAGFVDFDIASAGPGFKDLNTVDFALYDVVVVACFMNFGNLSQAELDILNRRTAEVVRYVNEGGGLVAFEESPLDNQFRFLPFLKPAAVLFQAEDDFKVTGFGKSLGLADRDVNTNFSHNIFTESTGFGVVDVDGAGRIISLATRKLIGEHGVVGDEDQGDEAVDPPPEQDPPPRQAIGAVSAAAPPLRSDLPNTQLPPSQGLAKPDPAPLTRQDPTSEQMQGSSQISMQAQSQPQSQAEVQGQTEAQTHAELQPQAEMQSQGAVMKEKERELQVQLAREDAAPGHIQSRGHKGSGSHLATGRQTGSPAGAAAGVVATIVLSLLGFARPGRQGSSRAALVTAQETRKRSRMPAPRHRRR